MNSNLYDLIENYKKGEDYALDTVVKKFSPSIKKFSKNLYYEEAETDLTISLITLVQGMNLEHFKDKNEGVLVNYIYQAIKNKHIDIYRRCRNNSIIETELIYETIEDTSPRFEDSIIMNLILDNLDEKELFVIKQLYYMDTKYKDIEDKLHISRQSIYNIRNRALNKLKVILEQ